jgi:hypothetical protein
MQRVEGLLGGVVGFGVQLARPGTVLLVR